MWVFHGIHRVENIQQEEPKRTHGRWEHTNILEVNAEKTELVLFTRRRKVKDFRLPDLDGKEIQLRGKTKYLGGIQDKKQRWIKKIGGVLPTGLCL